MVPNDTIPSVMNYANSCTALRAAPSCEQVRAGVIPLDSLPAAWWNCMWYDTNKAVNCTRYALTSIIQEINNVLAAAGKQVDQSCVDQLYESIETIRQTIGDSVCAGAVKSSSACGEVSINGSTGVMTVNGVGNAAYLTTSSHTVVNAINELKQTYTGCFGPLYTNIDTIDNIKANTYHAVIGTTAYGAGNAACYGHLKISDIYNSDLCIEGMTASQKAVSDMYNYYANLSAGAKECANCIYCIYSSICSSSATGCSAYLLNTNVSGYTYPLLNPNIYQDDFGNLQFLNSSKLCCCWIISGGVGTYSTNASGYSYAHLYSRPANTYACNIESIVSSCTCTNCRICTSSVIVRCCNYGFLGYCGSNYLTIKCPIGSVNQSLDPYVIYGQRCGYATSTLHHYYTKRTGMMFYSFWNDLPMGRSLNCWKINNCNMSDFASNLPQEVMRQNCCGYVYRALNNDYIRNNWPMHILFNIYIQPLYSYPACFRETSYPDPENTCLLAYIGSNRGASSPEQDQPSYYNSYRLFPYYRCSNFCDYTRSNGIRGPQPLGNHTYGDCGCNPGLWSYCLKCNSPGNASYGIRYLAAYCCGSVSPPVFQFYIES